ncbi:hypothetical protein ACJX0J_022259, partial [Zea mays]
LRCTIFFTQGIGANLLLNHIHACAVEDHKSALSNSSEILDGYSAFVVLVTYLATMRLKVTQLCHFEEVVECHFGSDLINSKIYKMYVFLRVTCFMKKIKMFNKYVSYRFAIVVT